MPYIGGMKRITIILAAVLMLQPAQAEEPVAEGFSLIEEGVKILLRGMMEEMEPALEDLQHMAEEMGPAMEGLRGALSDMSAYHAPEVLPNGDIIIRRKLPLEIEPETDIEL